MNSKTKAILASYGRSFLAGITTAFMVSGGDIFALNQDSLRTILAAGLAAVLPVLLRAINKKDPAFGKAIEVVADVAIEKVKAPTKKAAVKKTAAK